MLQLPEIDQIRRLRVVEVAVWWYRLSGQKSTNFESELSSKEFSLRMIGAIHSKKAFDNSVTDDIAHNCKIGLDGPRALKEESHGRHTHQVLAFGKSWEIGDGERRHSELVFSRQSTKGECPRAPLPGIPGRRADRHDLLMPLLLIAQDAACDNGPVSVHSCAPGRHVPDDPVAEQYSICSVTGGYLKAGSRACVGLTMRSRVLFYQRLMRGRQAATFGR